MYIQQYDHNPDWVLDAAHAWGLLSTAFAATAAASATLAAVFRWRDSRRVSGGDLTGAAR